MGRGSSKCEALLRVIEAPLRLLIPHWPPTLKITLPARTSIQTVTLDNVPNKLRKGT